MNMVDVKKVHRGVLLWREDVIKCEKCARVPLSQMVRNLLHRELGKYTLPDDGAKVLANQIEVAYASRKSKSKGRGRTLTIDRVSIPASVRKNPRFVRKGN